MQRKIKRKAVSREAVIVNKELFESRDRRNSKKAKQINKSRPKKIKQAKLVLAWHILCAFEASVCMCVSVIKARMLNKRTSVVDRFFGLHMLDDIE